MTRKLGISQAAAELEVSPDTIRRRIKRGLLPAEREDVPTGYVWRVLAYWEPGDAPKARAFRPKSFHALLEAQLEVTAEIVRLFRLLNERIDLLEQRLNREGPQP